MPIVPRLIVGSLLVLVGLVLLAVAVLGARGRLRRNRFFGVRTPDTLRSDAAFSLANRVAAAPLGAAGAVALVGGTVTLGGVGVVVAVLAAVGAVVLGGFGGMVGQRAASAAAPAPAPVACAGMCAGCDLVAGCRDGAATSASPAAASPPSTGGEG